MNNRGGRYPNQWHDKPSPQVKFNGLVNQGSTCYLNSVLQVLFMTEDFREAVERHARDNPETERIDRQLNDLFDNLKKDTARTNKITEKLKISRVNEQRDAAEYYEKILKLTSSEASQVFHGTLTHRTTCSNCEKPLDSDGKFWHLPLTLNSDGEYNVVDGISESFRDTHFSGDMKMYCENCDDKYDATIKCVLKHPPEVLMLLLKRFELNIYTLTYYKNKRIVRVPWRLQISENQKYELYALVEHSGELGSGHYSATIKSAEDGKWYRFNDTTVTLPNLQPFQSDNFERSDGAYLLFYRKQTYQAAAVCTPKVTGDVSPPKECLPSPVDSYNQPPNRKILREEGDIAEGGRAVKVISDQDANGGLKEDENSVSARAKRPSPMNVNVEGNHRHLQLQDKKGDQGRLEPNDEEAERDAKRKKKNPIKDSKRRNEDQTCEVRRTEPTSIPQYGHNSSREVKNVQKYPQNEGKTRENEKTGTERDLKVDPKEESESKKERRHLDEERFSSVKQDMTGDMRSGQRVAQDYDIKSHRKAQQGGGNMSARHDSEEQKGIDGTKPKSGTVRDQVYDRMQNMEKTGKRVQERDSRYDRDVKHKEEMNDRWAEENRRDESLLRGKGSGERRGTTETRTAKQGGGNMSARHDSERKMGTDGTKPKSDKVLNQVYDRMQNMERTGKGVHGRDHRYDRDVKHKEEMNDRWAEEDRRGSGRDKDVSEMQRKKHVSENFQNRDESFFRGEGSGERRGTAETRTAKQGGKQMTGRHDSERLMGTEVAKTNSGKPSDFVDDRRRGSERTGERMQESAHSYDRDVKHKEELNDRWAEENRMGQYDAHVRVRHQDVSEMQRKKKVDESFHNRDESFSRGETTDTREVRAESNVEKGGVKQPSTKSREIRKRTHDEIEDLGTSESQEISNYNGKSLAEHDKNRKGSRLRRMIRNWSLSKHFRNLSLSNKNKKQKIQRPKRTELVQEEDEANHAKKPRKEKSCVFPLCVSNNNEMSE